MKRKPLFILLYIVTVVIVQVGYNKMMGLHKRHFVEAHKLEMSEVQEKLQHQVGLIYQGLRTISRMPGVRKMDMAAQRLTPDAMQSVQEIFNNLNLSIHLSEVYIVPIDLDPDQIDARTKKMQEPLITFDRISTAPVATTKKEKKDQEEVEIFEYRTMKKQNTWLKKYFPTEKYISDFDVPMLSSTEVVTCDNSHFDSKHPDDKKRSGQVLSVPFYGEDGKLKGAISGVVLTDVLAGYLPNDEYYIESEINQYLVGKTFPASEKLIFDAAVKLNFHDPLADWYLKSSVTEALFYKQHDVALTKYFYYFCLLIISIFVGIAYYMVEQNAKLLTSQQKALEASVKLASMGEMTASIAHEINNPLAILVTKATLMKAMNEKGTLTKERITTDLEKLKGTAERIAKIIKGLKSLSRNAEADPFEKVSVKKIVDEALVFCTDRLKERNTELKVHNNIDEEVSCREVQISQVIINLVNNSSDAILELPEKWIEIEVSKNESKKMVVIAITDSGKGIPPEIAKKLMTAFFSTKGVGKGTGLGLSISKKILQEHGGDLRLDQSYHHTRFVIELPM